MAPVAVRRYPLGPLAALMGEPIYRACILLGLRGQTQQAYRRDGVTHVVADRLACRAGLHPYTVWPEMAVHDEADALEARRKFERDRKRRRYQSNPEARERELQRKAEYYAENRDVILFKTRLRRARGLAS